MESLGYVLIYLILGKLPWQNLPAEENETKKQKRRKIAEMKQNLPVEELCAGLPGTHSGAVSSLLHSLTVPHRGVCAIY